MIIRTQLLPCSRSILLSATRATSAISCPFSSSATLSKDTGSHLVKNIVPRNADLPPYPYGESRWYKQSNKGLYGNGRVQFGNNVSPDTETKTRRSWHPNVLPKSLFSIALQKKVKLRIRAKVLRTIDKVGGLDEYILGQKESRIKELGPEGWKLKWALMQRPAVRERIKAEARELGIPEHRIIERWEDPRKVNKGMRELKKEAKKEAQVEEDAVQEVGKVEQSSMNTTL